MAVSEYERHQVFHWFEEAMGPERAATMMNLLPPVSWAEIATKDDLMALDTRLRGEIAELRGEIKVGNAELLRTLMLGMVASNATLVGLVFAAVRLG